MLEPEPGEWIIGEDFNCVRPVEERKGKGRVQNSKDMEEFNNFIDSMNLVDVPTIDNLVG